MRKAVVVDTNVLVTAEGDLAHSLQCAKCCTNKLLKIQEQGCVALDTGWEILKEYQTNLSARRQPGVGFQFWKWVLNTRANPELCSWVTINANESRGYEEFPDHDGLRKFDPADRKFVAVAAMHPAKPPIVQATDSKWVGWKKSLAECGIKVEFVCEDEIEAKYKKKMKHG